MAAQNSDNPGVLATRTFSKTFEDALAQLKRITGVAVRTGALAGVLALGPGAGFLGCAVDEATGPEDPLLDELGAADGWLDSEAVRDADMVSYLDSSWSEYYDCNTRGGCMGVAVFLKLRVQPVAGANLDAKRVGVVYTPPGGQPQTAVGSFFTTYDNGDEEWHVRIDRRGYDAGVFRFDAWYQDGLGHTYIDDNNGEGHVNSYRGTYSVIYHYQSWEAPVTVGADGVQGRMDLTVADLDYDKDIRMVWTTDNWATTNVFRMAAGGTNALYWVQDTYNGYEQWRIDLDIEGPIDRFEYAFVYRYGGANCPDDGWAQGCYEFWDNNGGHNYSIQPR
jgi:hypothetical protein